MSTPIAKQFIAELNQAVSSLNVEVIQESLKQVKQLSHDNRVKAARIMWESLGNVPVNENHELDEDWLMFDRYDDVNDIWAWFERMFEISVAEDLMYINK